MKHYICTFSRIVMFWLILDPLKLRRWERNITLECGSVVASPFCFWLRVFIVLPLEAIFPFSYSVHVQLVSFVLKRTPQNRNPGKQIICWVLLPFSLNISKFRMNLVACIFISLKNQVENKFFYFKSQTIQSANRS